MAFLNPFRFSTKYQDDETDLLYYGYRYYNASTGRWLSSDPLNDQAFFDSYCYGKDEDTRLQLGLSSLGPLYCFVRNGPVNYWDRDGCELGYTYCCDGRMTLDASQQGLQIAGTVMTAGDAVVTGVALVDFAPSQLSKLKCLRCKVAIHSDHHTFPFVGKKCHLQITCWAKGVKGFSVNVRIPLPDRFCP
jgi:RHS repeat-associated protein